MSYGINLNRERGACAIVYAVKPLFSRCVVSPVDFEVAVVSRPNSCEVSVVPVCRSTAVTLMPPRMPMVAVGVFSTTGSVLLARPPTKRSTP